MSDWIDLREAAAILGYRDTTTLRHNIQEGRIPASVRRKFGNAWVLDRKWVTKEENRRTGFVLEKSD